MQLIYTAIILRKSNNQFKRLDGGRCGCVVSEGRLDRRALMESLVQIVMNNGLGKPLEEMFSKMEAMVDLMATSLEE